jgi:hypothetical protein
MIIVKYRFSDLYEEVGRHKYGIKNQSKDGKTRITVPVARSV